jgi:hypothetical protein
MLLRVKYPNPQAEIPHHTGRILSSGTGETAILQLVLPEKVLVVLKDVYSEVLLITIKFYSLPAPVVDRFQMGQNPGTSWQNAARLRKK